MRKYIFAFLLFTLSPISGLAQSSISDDQVLQLIIRENKAGTSQHQIVTKLIQSGANIQQIRRIKSRYERQIDQKGLGNVADEAVQKVENRMRSANGEDTNKQTANEDNRIEDLSQSVRTYDDDDNYYLQMMQETAGLFEDSISILKQQWEEERLNKDNKRVFGRDIFNKKDLNFEPNMNIATPQNYRLGPGDAVYIDIYGASAKQIKSSVSPDGFINIDDFGPVQVSGLTVEQANARLRSSLGARYRSSRIKLTVGQTRTITVNVMGEVKHPGTYTLSAFASVFHALYMAGGTNGLGTLRNIKVFRNNKLVTVVDVYDYILNGKLTGNIRLTDDDVIVVDPYDCLVTITGKIKRPMTYEMKKNESVGTLIKYSGGYTGDAYTKSVRLTRKTGREYSIYSVEEFDMSSFHLADGDEVSVDSIIPRFSNMVEIKGAVFHPGSYQVGGNIHSVRTLIESAEGVLEEAFTAHAVMHRMKPDRTLEVIPVDIDGIMSGKVADIVLQPNDVLFVPTKQEMMQQQTVTIHGEVYYPGSYKYAENETIEDLILQAGGLKETASVVKVDVARRIINPKALLADSIVAQTYSFSLKDGFVIDGQQGFTLMPYDEVYVRKSPGYSSQRNVSVEGHVCFAGTYTISKKNERLSDIIKKAGGVSDLAYVPGARIERLITPDERARMQVLLKRIQAQNDDKDTIDINKLELGDSYPVGVELDKALKNPGSDYDVILREGDRIIIPEYNGTVKISGDVMFPNTVSYKKGKSISYYVDQAGGFGNRAKKRNTFIIYMNGTIAKAGHDAKVMPGCEIVVPSKQKSEKLTIAQWLSIGTSLTSIAAMITTIANISK